MRRTRVTVNIICRGKPHRTSETLASSIKSNAREISGCVPKKKQILVKSSVAHLEIHVPRNSDAIEPKIAARKTPDIPIVRKHG